MKYVVYIYICASYFGKMECESYELTTNHFALNLFDKDENQIAHIEPVFGLSARVEIYKRDNLDKRIALYIINSNYAFCIKAPFAVAIGRNSKFPRALKSREDD